jgi:hypothetical protein
VVEADRLPVEEKNIGFAAIKKLLASVISGESLQKVNNVRGKTVLDGP